MNHLVLITGANRGIGLEFTRQYLEEGHSVIACCRQPEQAGALQTLADRYPDTLELVGLDVTQPLQLDNLADYLGKRRVDLLISNAGVYGPKGVPLGQYDAADFAPVMAANVQGPLMLVQALLGHLGQGARIALLSSKMGSIADNGSGGSYLYRASKAALNAMGKSLAIDLADRGIAVAILHPGWVQTDMGGPRALITTETSVTGMRAVMAHLNADNSGQFFNYDGATIPW